MSQSICAFFFWIKVALSVLIAMIAILYQINLVYELRASALLKKEGFNVPPVISIPNLNAWNASECFYQSGEKARLDPGDAFLWGFDLQWDRDTPESLVERLNHTKPAIFNSFIKMTKNDFQKDIIVWNAQEVGSIGGILEITVIADDPLSEISNEHFYKFAQLMRRVNTQYGTPVLLRFLHGIFNHFYFLEMNGNWLMYGQKPRQFKQAFVTMSSYIKHLTNLTAMVWSPNIAGGYPYGGKELPSSSSTDPMDQANFQDMNTNNQGSSNNVIDASDDPYGPYYPGDEWVDWVGLSVYNLNYNPSTHQTWSVSPSVFTDSNSGVVFAGSVDYIRNFYQVFSFRGFKIIAICS
jgi:hypothetical protein